MPKPGKKISRTVVFAITGLLVISATALGTWLVFFKGPSSYTEADVFNRRFPRTLIAKEFLYRPAVKTWQELRSELDRLHIPYSALESRKNLLAAPRPFKGNIFSLDFTAEGNVKFQTFFYRLTSNTKKTCGVLLIPGSGLDQSTEISLGQGYHGKIASTIKPLCDLFVLIRPNQGPLTIHNGKGGLDRRIVRSTLLNDGFSYGVTYLVQAQAILQHLRKQYQKIGVAGLSQGGEASLIISTLEQPDFAIVASGYSILNAEIELKSYTQLIHPNHRNLNAPEKVRARIAKGKTNYLFSWGLKEKWGYFVEASKMKTCDFFRAAAPEKISCVSHGGKHVFPLNEVETFIIEQTKPRG